MATVRYLGLFQPRPNSPTVSFQASCPSTNIAGINNIYPDVWLPENYALAIHWRVKKWNFNYAAEWENSGSSFSFSGSASFFYGEFREQGGDPPHLTSVSGKALENEKELVCYNSFGANIVGYGFPQIFFAWRTDAHVRMDGVPWVKVTNGAKQYRPRVAFFASIHPYPGIRAVSFNDANTQGHFSYDLLGETFQCGISSQITDPSLTVTASLQATEYWPYDPGDGLGPIYDSTTGAQLRPFPS